MRRRHGWWLLVAVLAASCTTSNANERQASDQTDVWFMQHMVPHLLQTTTVLDLADDQITRPELTRLADTINHQGQAHLHQLQGWLASRGLAAYDPQQDPHHSKEPDLSRLSLVRRAGFDLAFLAVMTARHRAALHMAEAEIRSGGVPEIRALARQMMAELQIQVEQMTAWTRAWAEAGTRTRSG